MTTFETGVRYLLLLAAVAAPCAVFPQPVRAAVAADQEQQLVETIQEEHSQGGPFSAGLIAPLTALGLLYQERGDEGPAAAAIGRALQVVRVNYGLHSLEQAPLIRQSIYNEEARGNRAAAWDLEQELLTLARRHPEDLRTVPILREHADRQMDEFRRHRVGEAFVQVGLGSLSENPNFGNRDFMEQSILWEAQRSYVEAISVILRHELYSSDELRELETELVRSCYQSVRNYELGRQSLRRLIAYDVANSEPWLTRMNGLIRMADWDLMFGLNGSALATYEEAYELLKEKGVAQESIEQIFAPKTPVALPTFLPNRLALEATPEAAGYVDVAFEIGKYGNARQLEILDTTTNATRAAKNRVVREILRGRFRPRLTDGKFGPTSRTVVRYYVRE